MKRKWYLFFMVLAALAVPVAAQTVFRLPGLESEAMEPGQVEVAFGDRVAFSVLDPRVELLQLQIRDENGRLLYDSGLVRDYRLSWSPDGWEWENRRYDLFAWDGAGQSAGYQTGRLMMTAGGPLAVLLAYDVTGNFTVSGYLGIGTATPERAVHIKGSNAVFRMDRSTNTAAFMLVRTDSANQPLKNFVLGVDASGPGNGQFVINDLGQSVSGGGTRRMTIDNTGNVTFGGTVKASGFMTVSAARFKEEIRPLAGALELVLALRGVRFQWKDSGQPDIGLIAEEVRQVIPEIVQLDEDGLPAGLDYGKLAAVLVEAVKTQQQELDRLLTGYQGMQDRLAKLLPAR